MSDLFAHLLSKEPENDKNKAKQEEKADAAALPHEEASFEAEENAKPAAREDASEEERLYFSISEVAGKFKVAPSLLRFWEKEFEQLQPKKNAKGTRFYTRENIEVIALIYHLVKERGYTLQGAREKLKAGKKMSSNNLEVVNTLKNIRKLLLEIKADLDQES